MPESRRTIAPDSSSEMFSRKRVRRKISRKSVSVAMASGLSDSRMDSAFDMARVKVRTTEPGSGSSASR